MKHFEELNYYERLNIPHDATQEQLRRAYRELAAVYHPDSNLYNETIPNALKSEHLLIFKLATEAYNVLSNPKRRADFDKSLAINQQIPKQRASCSTRLEAQPVNVKMQIMDSRLVRKPRVIRRVTWRHPFKRLLGHLIRHR